MEDTILKKDLFDLLVKEIGITYSTDDFIEKIIDYFELREVE